MCDFISDATRAMSVGILKYFILKRKSTGFPYQALMALYLKYVVPSERISLANKQVAIGSGR